jgi:hypothetical protein
MPARDFNIAALFAAAIAAAVVAAASDCAFAASAWLAWADAAVVLFGVAVAVDEAVADACA